MGILIDAWPDGKKIGMGKGHVASDCVTYPIPWGVCRVEELGIRDESPEIIPTGVHSPTAGMSE
jgi:hypothetical protein